MLFCGDLSPIGRDSPESTAAHFREPSFWSRVRLMRAVAAVASDCALVCLIHPGAVSGDDVSGDIPAAQ